LIKVLAIIPQSPSHSENLLSIWQPVYKADSPRMYNSIGIDYMITMEFAVVGIEKGYGIGME
jgi:hypothetical protein